MRLFGTVRIGGAAAGLLAVTLLSGCFGGWNNPRQEGGEATQQPEQERSAAERTTLTIAGAAGSAIIRQPFQDDAVMAELERRTGVRLDFSADMNVTDRSVKLSVLLAGEELPDIVIFNSKTDRAKVLNAQVAMPLDALVQQYGSDMVGNAGKALDISRKHRSDGSQQLFFLPGGVGDVQLSPLAVDNGWYLRWDLYRRLDTPALDTLDDLLLVLERMQQLEPLNRERKRTYGLGLPLSDADGHLTIDKTIAGLRGYVQSSSNDAYLEMKSGRLTRRVSDPDSVFWQAMQFYNEAYRRGLLDPESALMKTITIAEKYKSGRYLASPSHEALAGADSVFASNGDTDKGFVPFPVAHDPDHIFAAQATYEGNEYDLFIPKSSRNAEAAIRFINYLYTYDGARLLLNGVEGEHYTIKDGLPLMAEETLADRRSNPNHVSETGIGKYTGLVRFSPPVDADDHPLRFEHLQGNLNRMVTPVQRQYMDHFGYETVTEPFTKVPVHLYDSSLLGSLSTKPGSDIQSKEQQLDAYLAAHIVKVLFQETAEQFDKEKRKFLDEYAAKGAEDVFRYYETAYREAASLPSS